jgi:hypothetical protein
MTKKIVSLVSLVASAGALALTAVPAHALRARFENLDSNAIGVSAMLLVAFAASVVLTKLAYARK